MADGLGHAPARGVLLVTAVGGDGGIEVGELVLEMAVGVAEGFDAVGEGLVGVDAGDGDVGPVLVEAGEGGGDGVVTPPVGVDEPVVGVLVVAKPADDGVASPNGAGGVNDSRPALGEFGFGVSASGTPGPCDGAKGAEVVEAMVGGGDSGLSGGEVGPGRLQGAAGVGELDGDVGRLGVEHGLVGGDHLAEVAVQRPGVVDGGHRCVGEAG